MSSHRDVMGSAFGEEAFDEVEASDPMSGLSNLADCMLVLACGLMITLVVHWNLNVTPHMETVAETGALVDVDQEPELVASGQASADSDEGQEGPVYENMGTLYRDPDTGKLYYLREWEE